MAKREVKEQIIQAAGEEFVANGYSGARMQAIADAVGINKALLHYYYKSKQELYEQILELQFSRLIDGMLSRLDSDADFDTWLKGIINKYLQDIVSHPHFTRFLVWELSSKPKTVPGLFKKILQRKGYTGRHILDVISAKLNSIGRTDYDPVHFLLNVVSLCIFPSLAKPILEQVIGDSAVFGRNFTSERETVVYNLIKQGTSRLEDNNK